MGTDQESRRMTLPNDLRSMAESVGLEVPKAATLMMEAADTICELRELMTKMAEALGIDCEWVDANWCKSSCRLEFGCWPEDMDIRCPAWAAMRELGVEVD